MIPNQLIEKFNNTIIEWLDKGEKPDYNYSRECVGRWAILTNKRAIFTREVGDKLIYLFDSKELLHDWRTNGYKFDKHKTNDILISGYLLISLRVQGKEGKVEGEPKFSEIDEEFLRSLPSLSKKEAQNVIYEFINLLPFDMGSDYFFRCLNLNLPVLAVMMKAEYVTSMILSDPKYWTKDAKELMNLRQYLYARTYFFSLGEVCLMKDKYRSARRCFEELIEPDDEDSYVLAMYNWALGMEEWKKDNSEVSVECFDKAKGYFNELDDNIHCRLMEYLKSSIYAMEDVKPYDYQAIFLEFGREPTEDEIKSVEKGETQQARNIIERFPLIKDDLEAIKKGVETINVSLRQKPQAIENRETKPEGQRAEGGKAEYVIWDIKGKKPAFKKMVEDLRNRNKKGKLDIFVDEDGIVYFKSKKAIELKKSQILYNFLLYFLKNKGVGGTYENLFCEVWPIGKEKKFKPDFELTKSQKGNVIRMKNRLSTLLKNYSAKEIKYEYNKYRLDEDYIFCVIQKSIG